MPIEPGEQSRAVNQVTEGDTALALGTGNVPVVSTSRLIAWCEQASHRALADRIPTGSTSVAMRVHLDHARAVGIGQRVTSIATLERIEGRRYVFIVSVIDAKHEVVATGRVIRVVVETESFVESACGQSR